MFEIAYNFKQGPFPQTLIVPVGRGGVVLIPGRAVLACMLRCSHSQSNFTFEIALTTHTVCGTPRSGVDSGENHVFRQNVNFEICKISKVICSKAHGFAVTGSGNQGCGDG